MTNNCSRRNKQLLTIDLELKDINRVFSNGHFLLDANGIILDYKTQIKVDILPEFFLGKKFHNYLPIAVRNRFQEIISDVIQAQLLFGFKYTLELPEGTSRFAVKVLPLTESRITIIVRKISRRIQAKQERERFFEMSLDMFCMISYDFHLQQISPAWEKTLGWTKSKLQGISLIELIHPDDREVSLATLETAVNSSDPITLENRLLCQNGDHRSISWKLQTQSDDQLIYAVARENSNIYDELRLRQQREETLIERSRLADFRADVDTALTQSHSLQEMMRFCTEALVEHIDIAFARIWTLNKQENVLELQVSSGMYTHINGPHQYVPVGKFKIGLIAEENQPHLTNSVQTDPRVGNKEWAKREGMIAFAGYPLIVEGETLGVIAMFSRQALTESTFRVLAIVAHNIAIGIKRKQTEEALKINAKLAEEKVQQLEEALCELQQTQLQLIQTEKMSSLGQLVAGIAHEINNPISFIYSNISHAKEHVTELLHLVELYQQHYPDIENDQVDLAFLREDLPNILNSMNHGAERIRQIVLSLRNFSRLDEDGMKSVNIHEGIENTLQLLQHRLNAQPEHPAIEIIKEYGNLPQVVCYAGQINQVFINLLLNAIDALENSSVSGKIIDHPTICIRTFLKGDRIVISIADNGPGIAEKVHNRIFDPFFTTKPVGIGLGLSISYQIIVEKHRGQLQCVSALGQGAEFVMAIPLKP